MPAIYHEGSWLGNATDPEVLVKDTVGWTGKNLLKNTATTHIVSGVTITANADGTVKINGTATSDIIEEIGRFAYIDNTVILSGCPAGGAWNTYRLDIRNDSNVQYGNYIDTGSGVEFTPDSSYLKVCIRIGNGITVSDLTIYPMIRRADITDPTYEPYHESVEEEIEQIYADNGVLGAKNLLPYPYADKAATNNGVTYTYDEDGVVTLNGTATATSWRTLEQYDFPNLKVGADYILSGCPEGGASDTYFLQLSYDNGTKFYKETGNGVRFTNTGNLTRIQILVLSGITVNNVTFHPMIRLASDPDDTYVPHAMTNRELTENLFYKNKELKSSDNLDDITQTGLYYIYDSVPTNSPESISYCTVIVNQMKGIIQQTVIKSTASAGSIYVRTKSGSPLAWKPWMKFTGTVVS